MVAGWMVLLFVATWAFAQEPYVPRYDAFGGFSYLHSPKLNLAERGFNLEMGANVNRWLALGADYSYFTGHSTLFPQDLTPALQQKLAALVPPGVPVAVPFDSTTFTFTFGPQLNFRKIQPMTLFIRPAIGGLHQAAFLKPNTPLTTQLVAVLAPGGKKSDLEPFYGVGGGFDFNFHSYFGVRVAFDFVHVNLFEGFLNESRNSLRISVGPAIHFGPNTK